MTSGIGVVVRWCKKIYNKLEGSTGSSSQGLTVKGVFAGSLAQVGPDYTMTVTKTGVKKLRINAQSLCITKLVVDGVTVFNNSSNPLKTYNNGFMTGMDGNYEFAEIECRESISVTFYATKGTAYGYVWYE